MPATTVVWQETIGRGVTIALMHNFTSVADALKELVDNAIDYRWGQPLSINIVEDKRHRRVYIDSDGGRGMGAEEIQEWLNWGTGQEHDQSHIGKYHQGGKAACGFLGQHVKLWAKRANSDDIWFLEDENWSVRDEPRNFGVPEPLPKSQYPETMRDLPTSRGHVRIELTKLVKERRWNLEILKRTLSSTYRTLIDDGTVGIKVNGNDVVPFEVTLSTAVKSVEIHARLTGGKSVSGWAGRIMRDQVTTPVKAGLQLIHNGRLITEGEWFGYNHEGKGALNSLFGELHMSGFTTVPNKTDFVERGDRVWDDLSTTILIQIMPLIAELRRSEATRRISKREREAIQEVADELQEVFEELAESLGSGLLAGTDGAGSGGGVGGRKRPEPPLGRQLPLRHRGPNENPPEPRTPPPTDPVGTLARLLEKVTGGNTRPPLRIRAWDATERSAWTTEGAKVWLDVNKEYPLYKTLNGAKPYLAETAILEICKPRDQEPMEATQYVDRVDLMLLRWMYKANLTDNQPANELGL